MTPATLERKAGSLALHSERLGVVGIDGARHSLIWAHREDHSVSLLIDRPEQGSKEEERLIGAFWPDEDFEQVETVAADYEEHYVPRPRSERIVPRLVEPTDLESRGQVGRG